MARNTRGSTFIEQMFLQFDETAKRILEEIPKQFQGAELDPPGGKPKPVVQNPFRRI